MGVLMVTSDEQMVGKSAIICWLPKKSQKHTFDHLDVRETKTKKIKKKSSGDFQSRRFLYLEPTEQTADQQVSEA